MHRSTLTLLIANLGGALLSFALYALIGRGLGADGLGVYAVALAWVFPLKLLAEFGTNTLILRDTARSGSAALLAQTTPARLFLSLVLTLILVVGAPLLSSTPRALQIAAPLILIEPAFGAFTAVFRARQQMTRILWLTLGMLSVQVILTYIALILSADVYAVLAINTLTSGGQLIAAYALWRRDQPSKTEPVELSHALETLRQAAPFAVAGLLAALHTRTPLILLERLTNSAQAGDYSAANRLIEAARLLPQAYFDALFPKVSAAPPDQRPVHLRRAVILMSVFGLCVGLAITLTAPLLMRWIYGAGFDAAAQVLTISGWTLLPALLKGTYTIFAYADEHEGLVNRVTIGTLALRLIVSLWIIPAYGAAGAAGATLLIEIVSAALLAVITHTQRPFDINHK
jgi:polysaccharide transporter, PST family